MSYSGIAPLSLSNSNAVPRAEADVLHRDRSGNIFNNRVTESAAMTLDTQPRTCPFTLRITFEERRLLRLASERRKVSQAEVIRLGLDPILQGLRRDKDDDKR